MFIRYTFHLLYFTSSWSFRVQIKNSLLYPNWILKQFEKRDRNHDKNQQFITKKGQDWKAWVNFHPQSDFLKHLTPLELTNPKSQTALCKGRVCPGNYVTGYTGDVGLLMTGHPDPDTLTSDKIAQPWLSHPLSNPFLKLTHQLSLSSSGEEGVGWAGGRGDRGKVI